MRDKEVQSERTAWTEAWGPVAEELGGIQGSWSVDTEEEVGVGERRRVTILGDTLASLRSLHCIL